MTRKRPYTDVDGLITNEPNVVLATFYADCVPLYFVDPVHRAIGLSHSGWRGTVNRMGKETLIAMNREFGTEAHDVIAAIGPSICQDCYEISQDVAEHFVDEFATTDDPHAVIFCSIKELANISSTFGNVTGECLWRQECRKTILP